VLLDDLDLAVRLALNDGRVVCVDQTGLGVQVVDRVVVGQRVFDFGVDAGIRDEGVNGHCGSSFSGHQLQLTGRVQIAEYA